MQGAFNIPLKRVVTWGQDNIVSCPKLHSRSTSLQVCMCKHVCERERQKERKGEFIYLYMWRPQDNLAFQFPFFRDRSSSWPGTCTVGWPVNPRDSFIFISPEVALHAHCYHDWLNFRIEKQALYWLSYFRSFSWLFILPFCLQ